MVRTLICLIFLLFISLTNAVLIAQTTSKLADNLIVASPTGHKIYLGIPNRLDIGIANVTYDSLSVESDDALVKHLGGTHFLVTADEHQLIVLKIFYYKNSRKTFVDEKQLNVWRLPSPVVIVGGKLYGGVFTIESLKAAKVGAILFDFLYDDIKFHVKSFEISVVDSSGFCHVRKVSGETLPNPVVSELLPFLHSGDTIFLKNIKVIGPAKSQYLIDGGFYIFFREGEKEE